MKNMYDRTYIIIHVQSYRYYYVDIIYVRIIMSDDNIILQQFGNCLRTLREEKGWSQVDLSHKAELDPGYIGKIERGQVNPGLTYLAALARSFDMEVWELLARVNKFKK